MVQMVSSMYQNRNLLAASELEQNFSLAFEKVDEIRIKVSAKSITELIRDIDFLRNPEVEVLMQKCMEGLYDIKFDIVLLCIDALNNSDFYFNRFKRIVMNANTQEIQEINNNIINIFDYCKGNNRLLMLDYLCGDTDIDKKLIDIYDDGPRDIAFYIILIKAINKKLKGESNYE